MLYKFSSCVSYPLLTPVISISRPSLLLVFRVSGLDHFAPYLHHETSLQLLLLLLSFKLAL